MGAELGIKSGSVAPSPSRHNLRSRYCGSCPEGCLHLSDPGVDSLDFTPTIKHIRNTVGPSRRHYSKTYVPAPGWPLWHEAARKADLGPASSSGHWRGHAKQGLRSVARMKTVWPAASALSRALDSVLHLFILRSSETAAHVGRSGAGWGSGGVAACPDSCRGRGSVLLP